MEIKFGNYTDELFSPDVLDVEGDIIPIIADGDDAELDNIETPEVLPILSLRNTVLFPGVVLPISIARPKSIQLIKEVYRSGKIIGTVAQKDPEIDDPEFSDLHTIGSVGQIVKLLEMPDGSTTAIIQGRKRMVLGELVSNDPYFIAKIKILPEIKPDATITDFDIIVGSLKDLSLKIIRINPNISPEASFAIKNIENTTYLINFICSNTDIKVQDKQKLLEFNSLRDRGFALLEYLVQEIQLLELKHELQSKVRNDLDQQQREFLLHQQMRTIQNELGGNPVEKEIEEYKKRAETKKWNENVKKVFDRELEKVQRLHPAAGEYSVQINYIQTLLDLPWDVCSEDNFDLNNAKKILDEDHFGLDEVKERILEHLAVLKLKGDLKSPILCLYGPPGVGKTSLGKSVAKALNRKYVRMSLGGLHDEAEIRGHRKTYIGAMPGRIIQNIRRAGSSNPVFILDEIDKVGNDFRGDPSSALLEALDPEQNNAFYDNFLEMEYDLSKTLFIATANNIATINPALKDRMEMIEITGYLVEEKTEIANRHLLPKQLENHGINSDQLTIDKNALETIIDRYTRESGVRELDKKLAKIARVTAKNIASDSEYEKNLTAERLTKILGPPKFTHDLYAGNEQAGVVTGLAWTAAGGDVLFIETSLSKGTGKLTLTGNLGDVMKESAVLAHEYLKANAALLDLPDNFSDKWNIHIHVPEGAIPKDGPSAGITMATSIASAFTQRQVKKYVAMTGEITLRGKILPVGGIKEKILAAKRATIKEIILPEENRNDVESISPIYIKGLKFNYVDSIMEAFDIALLKQKVKNPKNISFE